MQGNFLGFFISIECDRLSTLLDLSHSNALIWGLSRRPVIRINASMAQCSGNLLLGETHQISEKSCVASNCDLENRDLWAFWMNATLSKADMHKMNEAMQQILQLGKHL